MSRDLFPEERYEDTSYSESSYSEAERAHDNRNERFHPYETQDTQRAAYLYAIGWKLTGIRDGKRKTIQLMPPDDCEDPHAVVLRYLNDEAIIEPKKLFACYKSLRNEFEQQTNGLSSLPPLPRRPITRR